MSHFTDFTGYVVFIITSFLAGVESADQCLLNSKVLSCFSGVIMSLRSFFLYYGLILEKVHRVIEFSQSASLKPYIDFNTKLRMEAKNDFEKDFFKLMNNFVFGKTMENIRKHKDIKQLYFKTVMKPNSKSGIFFSSSLMACEMEKTKVIMNKTVYLGQDILDLSKIIMYEFHYNDMLPKYC